MFCISRTLGSVDVSADESRTDLDSHADQCAVGRNVLVVHDYDHPFNVTGYDPNGPVRTTFALFSPPWHMMTP